MVWNRNALTERLGIEWPILQAPMGGFTTPALAAAVSNAGGLGGLGMWGFAAEDVERRIQGFRQQSGGSLNVNYPIWDDPGDLGGRAPEMRAALQTLYDANGLGLLPEPHAIAGGVSPEHLDVLTRVKPELVSFHFGLPEPATVAALKDAGVFIICSANSVGEARVLETGGVDAIIAQGLEAGGHRGTFTGIDMSRQAGLMALLPQVVDAVQVPVIAAGGIADGRGIAAALMLGASAVQIGTAFLRCVEADVGEAHRVALSGASDDSTVVTNVFTGRPARFVENELIRSLHSIDPLPFPAQAAWTEPLDETGNPELGLLYSGQAVALTREMPAADLIETLARETDSVLREWREQTL